MATLKLLVLFAAVFTVSMLLQPANGQSLQYLKAWGYRPPAPSPSIGHRRLLDGAIATDRLYFDLVVRPTYTFIRARSLLDEIEKLEQLLKRH